MLRFCSKDVLIHFVGIMMSLVAMRPLSFGDELSII